MKAEISKLQNRLIHMESEMKQINKFIEILEDCELKLGQPCYHKDYGVSMLKSLDYNRQGSPMGHHMNQLMAQIVHTNQAVEGQPFATVPLEELMPFNDSTRALYER